MDGWITIGAKLDSKQLEKDLKNSERLLQQYEKEAERLTEQKQKVQVDLQAYEKEKQAIEKNTNIKLQFAETQERVNKILDEENIKTQELNEKYAKQFQKLEDINKKMQRNAYNQELTNSKVGELNSQLNKTKGFEDIKNHINGIGNSMEKVVKKVARWGLAIFGIRSVYMMIRQSMSTLSQYDEQLATNIEYIRYAIATALKPIIEYIVKLVYQLLSYVNYLAKAWFKIDLFANASAESFKDAKNNAKGLNKELNKTTAGFDEMNTLSSSGTDSGALLPSYDLSNIQGLQNIKIPEWLKWIKEHGMEIATILGAIIGARALGGLLGGSAGLTGLLGVAAAALILYDAIKYKELYDEWKDLQKFRKELKEWQKENHKNYMDAAEDRKEEAKGYEKNSQKLAQYIGMLESNSEMNKHVMDTTSALSSRHQQNAKELEKNIELYVDLYKQGKLNVAQTQQYAIFLGKLGYNLDGTKMSTKEYTEFMANLNEEEYKLSITNERWNENLEETAEKVKGTKDETAAFGSVLGSLTDKTYKVIIDADTKKFKDSLNEVIKKLNNNDVAKMAVFGSSIGYIYNKQIPYLAKGGIINMPGRGVPVGGAIAGEVSREGVIPLTDSQQMALLGEAIGRYITVDLTNVVKLDSRQIARKVDKVNQSNDFVFNR